MNDGQKSLFSLRNGITANNFNQKKDYYCLLLLCTNVNEFCLLLRALGSMTIPILIMMIGIVCEKKCSKPEI